MNESKPEPALDVSALQGEQLSILGDFPIHQFRKSVAICTLTDDLLREALQKEPLLQDILVGSLHTENLGIEHLITYCVENPNIRIIIVCGEDGKKAIGHLPGQSFMALVENGVDHQGVIIGAQGKRPVLQNITCEVVEHFRQWVRVVDCIGEKQVANILVHAQACLAENPTLAPRFEGEVHKNITQETILPIEGYSCDRMITDPSGYFIIAIDSQRKIIRMEHYVGQGTLHAVIEGQRGREVYFPAIERGLVSRLDHAAYLGRELERAERCLQWGEIYVQDALDELRR